MEAFIVNNPLLAQVLGQLVAGAIVAGVAWALTRSYQERD